MQQRKDEIHRQSQDLKHKKTQRENLEAQIVQQEQALTAAEEKEAAAAKAESELRPGAKQKEKTAVKTTHTKAKNASKA